MVEKTKKIVHKEGKYYETTFCGVLRYSDSAIEMRKSWRWVTCKRCLRSKPKKGATK